MTITIRNSTIVESDKAYKTFRARGKQYYKFCDDLIIAGSYNLHVEYNGITKMYTYDVQYGLYISRFRGPNDYN